MDQVTGLFEGIGQSMTQLASEPSFPERLLLYLLGIRSF